MFLPLPINFHYICGYSPETERTNLLSYNVRTKLAKKKRQIRAWKRRYHGIFQSYDGRRLCRRRREVVGFLEIPQPRGTGACDITATEHTCKHRYWNNS
jgi:hypothetical protein